MRPIIATLALLAMALPALADEEGLRVPPVTHQATLKACGECHMAYPPALLPAASWRSIMAGLADHFGEDASLEAGVAAEIEAYLAAHAGRGDGGLLKISQQPWFRHDHDFPPSVWQEPAIRSPANCEACHAGAAQGIFDEPEGRGDGHGAAGQGTRRSGENGRGEVEDDRERRPKEQTR